MIQASTTPGQYTVVLSGDVEAVLTLGDAAALSDQLAAEVASLRRAVTAAQESATELVAAGAAVDAAVASDGVFDVSESMTRAELNAVAQHAGIEDPESLSTKSDVVEAIKAARA